MLKNFTKSIKRDLLVPNVATYRASVAGVVDRLRTEGKDVDALPSFSKLAADPGKSIGWFVPMCQTLFNSAHDNDELKVVHNIKGLGSRRVAMMFFPGNTKVKCLSEMRDIMQTALPNYKVIALNGSEKINDTKVSNANAEALVKSVLTDNPTQSVIIISAQMSQRSFSIPEITELYLAYDGGDMGATIQKMSRTLTPGNDEKTGNIISLSFDPNRDDKFASMVLAAAENMVAKGQKDTIKEALADVLKSLYLGDFTEDGSMRLDVDSYLAAIQESKGVSRVFGKIADFSKLTDEMVVALASGNTEYFRQEVQEQVAKGKTRPPKKVKKGAGAAVNKDDEKLLSKAREAITSIIENLDYLMKAVSFDGMVTLKEGIEIVENDAELARDIASPEMLGHDIAVVRVLFDAGIIREEIAELMHDSKMAAKKLA